MCLWGKISNIIWVSQVDANAGDVEIQVWSLGGEDPLEEHMATHSSILSWRIPWTGEPDRPQSLRSQGVRMTEMT